MLITKTRIGAFILIMLCGGLSVGAFSLANKKPENPKKQQPLSASVVKTTQSQLVDNARQLNFVGQIVSRQNIMLAAKQSGVVTEVLAPSGTKVAKGDVILILDSDLQLNELDKYKALAQIEILKFNRTRELSKDSLASVSELDEAKQMMLQAQAEVRIRQTEIEQRKLRAPFDGIVGINDISEGSYIEAGVGLFNFTNTNDLYVDVSVPKRVRQTLTPQVEFDVLVSENTSVKANQLIAGVNGVATTLETKIRAKLDLAGQSVNLLPGDVVDVRLRIDNQDKVIVVPERAVLYTSYGESLYVVKNDRALIRHIQTNGRVDEQVVVSAGLGVGEQVVTDGQSKLFNGKLVQTEGGNVH